MSLDVPERFKDGDDAQEDVTAPKRNNTMSMNQSLFSMIARAGQQSQTDLGTMQEADSGDSEDEGKRQASYHGLDGAARLSRLSSANDFHTSTEGPHDKNVAKGKHRRTLSENKLLRSLPKLKVSSRKEGRSEGPRAHPMSSSQFLPPKPSLNQSSATSKKWQPKSKGKDTEKEKVDITMGGETHVEIASDAGQKSKNGTMAGLDKSQQPVTLAKRIQQIFEFEQVEEVISEYPCWLLQSILLQGYMYITQKHICFYAYLPKKHVSIHYPNLLQSTYVR